MSEVRLLSAHERGHYARLRLAEFVANCRRKKMAVTPQRRAVMRALLESGEHPRAESIYARVRREHPRISLATVHRTLERLCEVGEARKVTPLHESARYDGNTRPHHHVVCIRCKRIADLEAPQFDTLLAGRGTLGEFQLLGCSVEVRALCHRCRAGAACSQESAPASIK
ncbi:MAG TPA: transcriptional repressor [Candidatus Binataceae bacterium]|nr:transcriptional repressor [Candidatus Binataceae bacterium]